MLEYGFFCVYGFRTIHPIAWKIELDPKSEWSDGNVTFKSPEKADIVVSWGPLERAGKSYSSLEEHAKDSIRRIEKESKVRKVELVQTKHIQVNSHKAIFSHVRIMFYIRRLLPIGRAKAHEREIRSLHLYCDSSKRYFIVYGVTTSSKSQQQGRIFKNIIKSFVCHDAKENPTNH